MASEGEVSIADTFSAKYTKALDKLASSMPDFIGRVSAFLAEATSPDVINKPSSYTE